MSLRDRFFGKRTPRIGEPPVANPRLTDPPAYIALFPSVPDLDADALTLALRNYHPELVTATAELAPEGANTIGLFGWDRHVVKLAAFASPLSAAILEKCVGPAHYDPELKAEAFRHQAHVLLFYAGYETDPLEQHVALATAAAMMAHFGALVVLNEKGRTSIPAPALLPHEEDPGDTLHTLRTFPLPLLYAGFVKLDVEDEPGVWMRTFGCPVFKLPDFAFHADEHGQGTATFNLFANMLAHLREGGQPFTPGDTLNVGEGMFLRLREPNEKEWFLEREGQLLVIERISPEEANQ